MKPENNQSGAFTFPAQEKLKSRKSIQSLFEGRKSFSSDGVRLIYKIIDPSAEPIPLFAVSVPKKYSKKAVQRNLLKRRIREAYRLNKSELMMVCAKHHISVEMMWIWTKPDKPEYKEISDQVKMIIEKLLKKINQ